MGVDVHVYLTCTSRGALVGVLRLSVLPRPFAHCIDYLTDYCVAEYIAPVVVSVVQQCLTEWIGEAHHFPAVHTRLAVAKLWILALVSRPLPCLSFSALSLTSWLV